MIYILRSLAIPAAYPLPKYTPCLDPCKYLILNFSFQGKSPIIASAVGSPDVYVNAHYRKHSHAPRRPRQCDTLILQTQAGPCDAPHIATMVCARPLTGPNPDRRTCSPRHTNDLHLSHHT